MKSLARIILFVLPAGMLVASCEGPAGPSGVKASESCGQCHNKEVNDRKNREYEASLHFTGEAFEEGSRDNCAPCHSTQGFQYVASNSTPATAYKVDAATTAFPAKMDCFTCHANLHTTFTYDDFHPLTWTEPVSMVMWGGKKTLAFSEGTSNLCAKCHQPRPVSGSAGPIDYQALVTAPDARYTLSSISFRTGVHYGTQGAMNGAEGAVEFGSGYDRTHPHKDGNNDTKTSCATCHMSDVSGTTGGHSLNPNYTGCNTTNCHENMSATSSSYTGLIADFNTKLTTLTQKINSLGGGHDILQKNPEDNLYHGYIDVYDKSSNPTGYWGATGNPALPALTNEQIGAIINFQLLVNDGSHGVHNPSYMIDLLDKTIAALQ